MIRKPKVGLLALYLKLYDDTQAWLRPEVEKFANNMQNRLDDTLDVVSYPICRIKSEIQSAVEFFKKEDVDAIVTLHLAYSPSLECYEALKCADMPIIVMDTTPDFSFDEQAKESRIMQNHGIHGVQDMCSVLRREEIPYQIVAGYFAEPIFFERIEQMARGAMMAKKMGNCRVGQIGESFEGMGDFSLDSKVLSDLGIVSIPFDVQENIARMQNVTANDVESEWEKDNKCFVNQGVSFECYEHTARVSLALRSWIEEQKLDALTVNFLETKTGSGLPLMPFLELCKCMTRGIGYAGEGDLMNAGFVSALMQGFENVTFAEMFCPDWEKGRVLLSHMGEFNLNMAKSPLLMRELDFTYADADNPVVVYGCMRPNKKAGFINLNPIENGRFVLIVGTGEMQDEKEPSDQMQGVVRGWFAPNAPLNVFLEEYSRQGGGHHGAVIEEIDIEILRSFAYCMDWDFVLID